MLRKTPEIAQKLILSQKIGHILPFLSKIQIINASAHFETQFRGLKRNF
jgi:hypothetical protein